jgi:hypothetical protein
MMICVFRPSYLAAPFFALACLVAHAQSPAKSATTQPASAPAAAAQPAAAQPAAATSSCSATVTDKKLAGAAKNSFMKKCEREATATCETSATDRKLAGAAKNSFLKKCVKDAVGA